MEVIKLWDSAPGYEESHEIPLLEYYPAEHKRGRGTVIIFPGGGYEIRAPHEGKGYAEFLNSHGMDAFVLQYRVSPARFPYPLLDARRAVRFVRSNADRFGIDKDKIAVMGSSAGGHLAELVSTYRGKLDGEGIDALDSEDFRPNAQILCYPVTDIKSHRGSYVNLLGAERAGDAHAVESVNPIAICPKDAPAAFIWHTETDTAVAVLSTYKYAAKLRELDIRTEMHIYPSGAHGLGLAEQYPSIRRWSSELIFWLTEKNYI